VLSLAGNVRELQNVIATLAVAAPSRGWVRPAMLPSIVGVATRASSGRLGEAREQFERDLSRWPWRAPLVTALAPRERWGYHGRVAQTAGSSRVGESPGSLESC